MEDETAGILVPEFAVFLKNVPKAWLKMFKCLNKSVAATVSQNEHKYVLLNNKDIQWIESKIKFIE